MPNEVRVARRSQLFLIAGLVNEAGEPTDAVLAAAIKRLTVRVVGEWLALAVLLLAPALGAPVENGLLGIGDDGRTVFNLGVVAVAIHSGARLAELLTARRLRRELSGLPWAGSEG